ncbi:ATP-binding protein [Cognatishimia sp. MH4019]|uniref:ATP-binding protein n=1 Tax=Cognatishimia sp. MH4019 TaxID=2854030 RepID=UPI001CD1DA5A|nr:ATP-binding protein [Cognatishimia sp. MH4019]
MKSNRFSLGLPGVPLILFLVLSGALTAASYLLSFNNDIRQLSQAGTIRLAQASDRLLGQLENYRELPNYLARHPDVIRALRDRPVEGTHELLAAAALTSGADDIYLLDPDGTVIASSDYEEPVSFLDRNFATRPDVVAAMSGALGVFHAIEVSDDTRDFFLARGVHTASGRPKGVVVVKVDIAQLEFEWRIDEDVVAFFDENDVVFSSNRPGLILRRDGGMRDPKPAPYHYPADRILPFFDHEKTRFGPHEIWTQSVTGVLPSASLVLTRALPQIDMTARVFISTATTHASARLQAMLTAALLAVIGLVLFLLAQRRQRLSDQLEIEAAANARLEARVEERTGQLRQAQDELVQAGKLSALGQMSAAISHELNQPLAAIQNFAANSQKFINRDHPEKAIENLGAISAQTDRMSRIIRNLRAFAHKEPGPIEPVDLNAVVEAALGLVRDRLDKKRVTVQRAGLNGPVWVMGGQVRLQQVIVNLLGNAMDAMSDQDTREITLEITRDGKAVSLDIRDTGAGLSDPDRVFEPFYSTKDIGASKGLGLGLSISYGIIGSFGGDLSARNLESGGAGFRVTLHASEAS